MAMHNRITGDNSARSCRECLVESHALHYRASCARSLVLCSCRMHCSMRTHRIRSLREYRMPVASAIRESRCCHRWSWSLAVVSLNAAANRKMWLSLDNRVRITRIRSRSDIAMARRTHAKPEVEHAIQYAEAHGWTVKVGGSHAWGRMYRPYDDKDCRCGEFCIASIWSTPRNARNHARQIRRVVDNCSRERARRDRSQRDSDDE